MANSEHLEILLKGEKAWNDWRDKNPKIKPQLGGVNLNGFRFNNYDMRKVQLVGTQLQCTDFCEVSMGNSNLSGADLFRASLKDADIHHSKAIGTNFSSVDFMSAMLFEADLSDSNFDFANLYGADLLYSKLDSSSFTGANLDDANLSGVSLKKAQLVAASFNGARLGGANFEKAIIGRTAFANVDLSHVKGLDSLRHYRPSSIGIDTLFQSRGKIPEQFLREAGVPEILISYLPALAESTEPIQWHSCFISYSTKDDEFAHRLHGRMRQAKLRVWFAPEHMKGGNYFFEQIERAIQLHDRLLLVLSEDSIQSKWVEREIRKARKVERLEKRRKLFPIRLVDMKTLREWECLDSDTGEDLAEEVRKYHIPDFSNWKNHDDFEKAFTKLEKDLRTSIEK